MCCWRTDVNGTFTAVDSSGGAASSVGARGLLPPFPSGCFRSGGAGVGSSGAAIGVAASRTCVDGFCARITWRPKRERDPLGHESLTTGPVGVCITVFPVLVAGSKNVHRAV